MATVRTAREQDIPRILELYRQLALTPPPPDTPQPSPEAYQRAFREINSTTGYWLLVAEEDGEILGTAVMAILPGIAHGVSPFAVVEYVVVDEKCRRRGIGKMLMGYIIARAKEAGCYKITLTSNKKRAEPHEFYHSLGFDASAHGFRYYF